MDTSSGYNLVIRWLTKDRQKMQRIRDYFGLPGYTTLNGLTPCWVKNEQMVTFLETEKRGFFRIMPLKWCKNGEHFTFINR